MRVIGVIALLIGCYVACLVVATLGTFATLAVTEGWGAGRTGDAMMALLGGIAVAFLVSVLVVFLVMTWMKLGIGWRLLAAAGYGAVLAGTLYMIAFLCAVIFNR
jgi:hypothetical protein